MDEHEHSHNQEKQMYWDKQSPLFEKITQSGGIDNYTKTIEYFERAFTLKNRTVCCVDERVTDGTIHYAGCGILDREHAAEQLRKAHPDGVRTHKGCGAAKKAYEKLSPEEKNRLEREYRVGDAEGYAKWWGLQLARELGVEYKGHSEVTPEFHNARAVYYDGTGAFTPSALPDLPSGFVISRRYLKNDYAKEELQLVLSIAFGDHGFGRERFLTNSPLQIILVGGSEESGVSLEELRAEAEEIAKENGQAVVIDGFIAPRV